VGRKVIAVAVVQFAVLSWLAALLPTWQDEEFTLATTAHGVGYAIHRALTYELQAPLYFALLAALRYAGRSVFLAREFSVVAQVATTFACATIARRIWPARDPWLFCALVASSPFALFAGLEIRTYALSLAETAFLVVFFFDGFFSGSSLRARLGFILMAIAGLYTQYFIVFVIAALFVALAICKRFVALRVYVVSVIVAIVAFVPLGLFVRTQASDTLSVEGSPAQFGGMLLHPINLVLSRPYNGIDAHWEGPLWLLLRLAALMAVVLGRPRLGRKTVALCSLFVVVDMIYVVLSDVEKLNLVFPRHFIALFLPEAILVYALVAAFAGRFAKRSALAVAIVFAISNALTTVLTYAPAAKQGDAARIGAYLSEHARPGDAIAVYPGDGVPAVARYYTGALPIEGYPVPQDPNVYQVDAALVRSPAEANAAFDRLPRAAHLFFVVQLTCGDGNIHGCGTVERVFKERYRVLEHRAFFEAELWELAPK
jgi:hypothetical protein